MIYVDSDAFRKLGDAFSETCLPDRLREQIVVSPISASELMAQLVIQEADRVLASIHAMRNWLPVERAIIMDWQTAFVAERVFGMPSNDEAYRHVGDALNACLVAETAAELREPAQELREVLDSAKDSQARFDQEFLERFRAAPVPREEFPNSFARAMAERAGAHLEAGQEARIVARLNGYFEYQTEILMRAAANPRYNFFNHLDRLLDAEQLLYLADPRLHFVTGDREFPRIVQHSPQRDRIHFGTHEQLIATEGALALLEQVAAGQN